MMKNQLFSRAGIIHPDLYISTAGVAEESVTVTLSAPCGPQRNSLSVGMYRPGNSPCMRCN